MSGMCLSCEFNDCTECEDYIALGQCCCGHTFDEHHGDFEDDDFEDVDA